MGEESRKRKNARECFIQTRFRGFAGNFNLRRLNYFPISISRARAAVLSHNESREIR